MAIKTVQAVINGSTYNLVYDSGQGAWIATFTAPGATSFNLPGGYYNVQITARNDAGTTTEIDGALNEGCRLKVKETIKPVITVQSPTDGAFVTNNQQPIVFNIIDEAGGSGININSLEVKIDSEAVTEGIKSTTITNGYSVTVTPQAALGEGLHSVTINCKDNDGNAAITKTTSFTVDTVPPTLNITSPAEGLITAEKTVNVIGTTNDSTSSPTTVTVNGASVTVNPNGSFTHAFSLNDGLNTITVVATDSAGKKTTIVRHVTLNSKIPKIESVTITPNPANTGASMVLKVVVSE